ncbi:MAG: hypothetical protein ABSD81_09130 [Methanomicrobiales archaeon]|jgi:hypothetical protein
MERKRIIILGILLFFLYCIAFMALRFEGQVAQGTGVGIQAVQEPEPQSQAGTGTSVESISDLGMFTIDPAFIQATPHWIIIVAGKKEQEAMIRYIENTSVASEKKAEWESTMRGIWAAYPVKAVDMAQGTIITCDCNLSTMSLTGSQNATMREIETEIALDMEKYLATPTPAAG